MSGKINRSLKRERAKQRREQKAKQDSMKPKETGPFTCHFATAGDAEDALTEWLEVLVKAIDLYEAMGQTRVYMKVPRPTGTRNFASLSTEQYNNALPALLRDTYDVVEQILLTGATLGYLKPSSVAEVLNTYREGLVFPAGV